MENRNNDIKTYTAEDIARYWQGKMSPQEMHALEAAAMDDPFLADALEGYSGMQPAVVNADVQELNERLTGRAQNDKKVVPFKWWRVAAILLFLGGASLLTYQLMKQQEPSTQVAKTEAAADTVFALPADTLMATASTLKDSAEKNKDSIVLSFHYSESSGFTRQHKANVPPITSAGDVAVPDLSEYKAKDSFQSDVAKKEEIYYKRDSVAVAANDAEAAERLQRRVPGIQTSPRSNAPTASQDNRSVGYVNTNPATFNNFSGRVIDQLNNAIPFATVRMNDNNQVASTNADGYFTIKSPDSVLNLVINSVGYQSRPLTMRGNEPQNYITLDALQGKAKGVAVTEAKSAKKSSRPANLNVYVMDAQPVIGWDEYNKYIETNKRAPADKSITGEVIVSFWVNKRGRLSDFTIEKSLGKQQDDEAIRLVKDGPEWKLNKGKKTRARVVVAF